MNLSPPRLRMFAGPNGSGKSTIKAVLRKELLGVYVNPDEIEQDIRNRDFLDLLDYGITTNEKEILEFFDSSVLLEKSGFLDDAAELRFSDNKLSFFAVSVNAYFASVAADFIRQKLIESGRALTFETVMSSPDKVELLCQAQVRGYRTYLYYVATEDPEINISRVQHRVKMGGHNVPNDKIISRYYRSLDLLMDAVQYTHRAYIFDNSSHERIWLAEITNGKMLEMKTDQMPGWFESALWNKFLAKSKEKTP
jgi:predicted ABC-type ATPase